MYTPLSGYSGKTAKCALWPGMSKKEKLSPHFGILLSIAAFELAFHWKKEKEIRNYKLYGIIWPLSIFLKACGEWYFHHLWNIFWHLLCMKLCYFQQNNNNNPALIILWSKAWFLSNSRIIAHAIFVKRFCIQLTFKDLQVTSSSQNWLFSKVLCYSVLIFIY